MLSQTEINWSEIYNELIDNLFNIYQTMKIENFRKQKQFICMFLTLVF